MPQGLMLNVTNLKKTTSREILFSVVRSSTLSIIQRDSPYIHLYDLHCPNESSVEPRIIKRFVAPFPYKPPVNSRNITVSNLSWHPTEVERFLALSGSGTICDFSVPQRVAMSWDPKNNLCGSVGVNLYRLNSVASPPNSPTTTIHATCTWDKGVGHGENQFQDDIAQVIHRRALNDYGKLVGFVVLRVRKKKNTKNFFQPDIARNSDLAPHLASVWTTLANMQKENYMLGLKTIFGVNNDGAPLQTRSEPVQINWIDYSSGPSVEVFRYDTMFGFVSVLLFVLFFVIPFNFLTEANKEISPKSCVDGLSTN